MRGSTKVVLWQIVCHTTIKNFLVSNLKKQTKKNEAVGWTRGNGERSTKCTQTLLKAHNSPTHVYPPGKYITWSKRHCLLCKLLWTPWNITGRGVGWVGWTSCRRQQRKEWQSLHSSRQTRRSGLAYRTLTPYHVPRDRGWYSCQQDRGLFRVSSPQTSSSHLIL